MQKSEKDGTEPASGYRLSLKTPEFLPVGRIGYRALADHLCQKRFNIGLALVRRMFQAMKPVEVFDPIDVSIFGSEAIVQLTNLLKSLTQQPG